MDNKYRVVGVMSGTSLDGLDLVICEFERINDTWSYHIVKGDTVEYSLEWKDKLANAQKLSAYEFVKLHRAYGAYVGKAVSDFLEDEKVDLVASHGHTVFHEPDVDVSFQIGCGAYLAANCKCKVVSDFRTLDIALGGQGAPLVPIGDKLLFGKYDACINLGGFANISFDDENTKRVAYDISPLNIVMNRLMESFFQLPYDCCGNKGREGSVELNLLNELNDLNYYKLSWPKSLGREWVEKCFDVILKKYERISREDLITTCYHHFADQIAAVINTNNLGNVLFTGGGTYNEFLMELVASRVSAEMTVPTGALIDFKEAVIFAFLGVLHQERENNCLSSVTGAKSSSVGGGEFIS